MVWQNLRYFIHRDAPYTVGNKNPLLSTWEIFIIYTTKNHSQVSVYVLLRQKLLHFSYKYQSLLLMLKFHILTENLGFQ